MQKRILLKVNLFICFVIVAAFSIMFAIDYTVNTKNDLQSIEYLSGLTSESISGQMELVFTEPVSVSRTMANSRLLIDFLQKELHGIDAEYVETIRAYLDAYREKYGYDSVFLASTKTGRYYNFNGIDRTLTEGNSENVWYYDFIDSGAEYSLNVDNDEAAQDEITVFVNCRINDDDGAALGIVGVGLQIVSLQNLLLEYASSYGVDIYLIDNNGDIELAANSTGWQPENFFSVCGYPQLEDEILRNRENALTYWLSENDGQNYIVAKYIPEIKWHLVVEHNTGAMAEQARQRIFSKGMAVIITVLVVSLTVAYTIRRYNKRIIELAALLEREKHAVTNRELVKKAETDGLTGLYNKTATEQYAARMLTDNPGKLFALFILDMDNFKYINDKHGHAFGDFVISTFAKILKSHFRENDVVGRIGGDEFAAFLPISNFEFLIEKVKVLSSALDTECKDELASCVISASIGIAVTQCESTNYEILYKNADAALYETKRQGKNGYAIYDEGYKFEK